MSHSNAKQMNRNRRVGDRGKGQGRIERSDPFGRNEEMPDGLGCEEERGYQVKVSAVPLRPLNKAQARLTASIRAHQLTVATGPAGTGKTRIAAHMAARMLEAKEVERIVLTRPAVEAEEELGFLPGEMDDKYAPWFAPFRIELCKELGSGYVDLLLKRERIVVSPLAYMRGLTFENDFVVLDEAQNTTKGQMKLFLTRLGEHSKAVVDGDLDQPDLGPNNGLADVIKRLNGCPGVNHVEFGLDDIVRSGLVREILRRY